jgi:hypothetical protein
MKIYIKEGESIINKDMTIGEVVNEDRSKA